jgi:hypothetical protein
MRTPISYIEKFLDEKSSWLEKHISKNSAINSLNDDIFNYKKIYVGGNILSFYLGERNLMTESEVFAKDIKCLKKLFVDNLGGQFLLLFDRVSGAASLKYKSVNFKDYKSRWGCCDSKNNIIFNYKLLMLPECLQEYVILHELCHTVCHDHSKNFWALVGHFMPDYKSRIAKIKTFAFVTKIY